MQRVGAVWMPKIGLFVEINNNKKNRNKGSVGAAWMLRIPTTALLSLVTEKKEKMKIISHAKHGEQSFDFANFSSPWFDDEDSGILATGHCR